MSVWSWPAVSRFAFCLAAAAVLDAETRYLPSAGMNRRLEDLASGQTLRLSFPAVESPTMFTGLARIYVPDDGTELEVRLATETAGAQLGLFVRFNIDVTVENGKGVITYGSEGPAAEKVILAARDSTPALRTGWYYIAAGVITPKTAISATLTAIVRTSGGGTPPAEPRPGASSRIIATVAGTDPPLPVGQAATESAIGNLGGVLVDGKGDILFSASNLDAVFRIARDGGLTLVAGSGIKGYAGDGGAATSARLNDPEGLAIDADGSLYIADSNNHSVRKVGAEGTISTVAGNGRPGFSGDGGPATSASLNSPEAVAVDSARNLYIFDTLNHRIRRVEPAGLITTFAGSGVRGFRGDGGPAREAALNLIGDWSTGGVAADAFGNVFFTDGANHRVRRVAADGMISTFAGNGASELVRPGFLPRGARQECAIKSTH